MSFKLGADPELFLWNTETRRYESAHDLVPGTKDKPYPLSVGAVQVDGVAVEFNINPASSGIEFASNIKQTLDEVRSIIPMKYEFKYTALARFNGEYWKKVPDDPKQLGCSEDYNSGQRNVVVNPVPNLPEAVRCGGGHLHIGWREPAEITPSHFWDAKYMVRKLTNYFSIFRNEWESMDALYDRSNYQNFHSFRPKPYGTEFRGLSNEWLKFPKLWPWLFDTCKKIYEEMKEGQTEKVLRRYDYNAYDPWTGYTKVPINNALAEIDFPMFPSNWKTACTTA